MPLGINPSLLPLCVNSKADRVLYPWLRNWSGRRKTLNSNQLYFILTLYQIPPVAEVLDRYILGFFNGLAALFFSLPFIYLFITCLKLAPSNNKLNFKLHPIYRIYFVINCR